jgi:hypothetical protein
MAAARSWGMTGADVLEAHRAYLTSLASEALADGRPVSLRLRFIGRDHDGEGFAAEAAVAAVGTIRRTAIR